MDKKQRWGIVLCFVLGIVFTILFGDFNNSVIAVDDTFTKEASIVEQSVQNKHSAPIKVLKIYNKQELIGVIQDRTELDALLLEVYQTEYEDSFPDVSLSLVDDVYIVEEDSYFSYEDKDEEICAYLQENDLFAVEVNKIIFSNGAIVYVKNLEDFHEARNLYVLNFISKESLDLLTNNIEVPPLQTYGEREISIEVLEKILYSKGYASKDNILMNTSEVVEFLSYGYDTELQYYTVREFDTIEGVGRNSTGLTAQQVVTINLDQLKSVDQVLTPGMELNVTYFQSPLSVHVVKEKMVEEITYPSSAIYVEDPTLREGLQQTDVYEQTGTRDVVYRETYINGVLVEEETEILSSVDTKQPVRAVIRYGTKVIPGIGSGTFRYPVNNPVITCRWWCYYGHNALDLQNRYQRWNAPIYAADRGVITMRSYNGINGYYIWIDHNNGFETYYGHMASPGLFPPGVAVEKGEVIGYVGDTGDTTGPHIHFAIEKNGTRVNPCNYLGC